MSHKTRQALIKKIEQSRKSRVICYVTGDRTPTGAQIGDDAIRPIYQQIREIGATERIDFFLYTRGGAIDVPWRIVSALRAACKEWNVLIPFRANSAGTLIALGADHIVMGPQAELGPIDPSMAIKRMVPGPGGQGTFVQDSVSVEDVMAYVKFIQDKGGLKEQQVLSTALDRLIERVDAVALGNVYRTHQHIRDVARRILQSRQTPPSTDSLDLIISTLAERVYAHGHAIGVSAAKDMGLPVEEASPELDKMMWELFEAYESDMKLNQPVDPAAVLNSSDRYAEDATIAIVESSTSSFEFKGELEVRARRQLPQTLQVSLNLNLQLPPGINPQTIPANAQQILQALLQELQKVAAGQAQQAVQQALNAQAPLLGAEAAFRNGRWERQAST